MTSLSVHSKTEEDWPKSGIIYSIGASASSRYSSLNAPNRPEFLPFIFITIPFFFRKANKLTTNRIEYI